MQIISNQEATDYIESGLNKFGDKIIYGSTAKFFPLLSASVLSVLALLVIIYCKKDLIGIGFCSVIVVPLIYFSYLIVTSTINKHIIFICPEYMVLEDKGRRVLIQCNEILYFSIGEENKRFVYVHTKENSISVNKDLHTFKDRHGKILGSRELKESIIEIISDFTSFNCETENQFNNPRKKKKRSFSYYLACIGSLLASVLFLGDLVSHATKNWTEITLTNLLPLILIFIGISIPMVLLHIFNKKRDKKRKESIMKAKENEISN